MQKSMWYIVSWTFFVTGLWLGKIYLGLMPTLGLKLFLIILSCITSGLAALGLLSLKSNSLYKRLKPQRWVVLLSMSIMGLAISVVLIWTVLAKVFVPRYYVLIDIGIIALVSFYVWLIDTKKKKEAVTVQVADL